MLEGLPEGSASDADLDPVSELQKKIDPAAFEVSTDAMRLVAKKLTDEDRPINKSDMIAAAVGVAWLINSLFKNNK